jgi:uncharacterized protein YfaS (alpha-2-macroglobulin family)
MQGGSNGRHRRNDRGEHAPAPAPWPGPTRGRAAAFAGLLAALLVAAAPAGAVRVAGLSPQGEVAEVRQVVVRFDAPAVALGQRDAAAPYALLCNGRTPPGDARWNDERTWVYALREPLPAGQRCTLQPQPGFMPVAGAWQDAVPRSFSTGAPTPLSVQPYPGGTVDEDAHFLLQLNGRINPATLAQGAWCEVEGLGERIPLQVADTATLTRVLRSQYRRAADAHWLLLACQRPLPADAAMRLVWGPGIAAAENPSLRTRTARVFDYRVRPRFTAEFSCERENAASACLPLRPLTLNFSAPVPRAQALGARLLPLDAPPGTPTLLPVADEAGEADTLQAVRFAPPFTPRSRWQLVLPPTVVDDAARPLANAGAFPLTVAVGDLPPLAKVAGGVFGVLERPPRGGEPALLPITVRHVQADLAGAHTEGDIAIKHLGAATPDATLLGWLHRVQQWHERRVRAQDAGLPQAQWLATETFTDARGRERQRQVPRWVATRELSLLAGEPGVQRRALPGAERPGGAPAPTEVLGLPLPAPGLHVVELRSRLLGQALLAQDAPMYVRSTALVTNLAVHFKHGRDGSLAWVTTLDRSQPAAGAQVAVNDCRGQPLWTGRSDAQGLVRIPQHFGPEHTEDREGAPCLGDEGLFITARHGDDLAFVRSGWQRGIEPWRFNLPTRWDAHRGEDPLRVHTVFDRVLLRAGETVSMKHLARLERSGPGPRLQRPPAAALPSTLVITHRGSGTEHRLPVAWTAAANAQSHWPVPRHAVLGTYDLTLEDADGRRWAGGSFRVEALRVPLVDARLTVPAGPDGVLVAPARVAVQAQLNAMAGGGLPQQALQLSALLRPRTPQFAGWDGWRFEGPRQAGSASDEDSVDEADPAAGRDRLLQTLQARTDAQGAAAFTLDALPPLAGAAELLAELRFTDLNGEVQSVLQRVPLAPSALVLGLRVPDWARTAGRTRLQVAVLDHAGRPQPGRTVQVQGRHHRVLSTRQRIVGGFYAYANTRQVQDLGPLCQGRSDARGLLDCEVDLSTPGEVELVALARDDAGRAAEAATTVWVSGAGAAGEWWFAQGDDDRIDLLPEQREVQPGQTARLQVRMPFREATALVTVEREGVIDARVVTLRGRDPVVEVPVPAHRTGRRGAAQGTGEHSWAPNIVVSVLVLRGREQAVPWWSAFTWGWRSPRDWWQAWRAGEGPPPTALADLARPAFRIGAAALRVGLAEHRLDVQVQPERSTHGVRETAQVTVRVTQHGRPVPHAELAFAAVDEGLLALAPNASWDLLDGLLPPRPWGVHTATAQGDVIGRRHFGRKALAAGGGGGSNPTRELFDTLLLWQGRVTLDAQGQARIAVPLNDSLTRFRLVAVAEAGDDRFGTGSATLRVTQDLQLLPGLPALVREGDRFDALLTLRNTTTRRLAVQATLAGAHAGGTLALAPQTAVLEPGAALPLQWPVQVPEGAGQIAWEAQVTEASGTAAALSDRVRWVQAVAPAVPVQVLQASLQRLPAAGAPPLRLPLAAPATALAGRGGVALQLSPSLAATPPGLVRWWRAMDWTCLEQQASRAMALGDRAAFDTLAAELPAWLDADGLPLFYPPRPGDAPRGSERLAAHLLLAAHAAGWRWPAPVEEALLQGLADFTAGRLERRDQPAPRPDADARRLAALHALAVHGRAGPRALDAISFSPAAWPTSALLDALGLLHHTPALAQREARLAEVQRVLRSRVQVAGRQLGFSTEAQDAWWWLMEGPDANAARWLLALLDGQADTAGLPEPAALLTGLLARQRRGAWDTTTANLWGALALQRFAQRFEAEAVTGRSVLVVATANAGNAPATALQHSGAFTLDWAAAPDGGGAERPWPGTPGTPATLWTQHQGTGQPWLAVQASAAVPLAAPVVAGYRIEQRMEPLQQRESGRHSRGDVVRVHLTVHAEADMAWVAVTSPIPGGASLLGSGLARDVVVGLDAAGAGHVMLAWEERGADAWRGSFEWLPRGRHTLQYTLRLNHAGQFAVPPVRVQAMYAPELQGERPQAAWTVQP